MYSKIKIVMATDKELKLMMIKAEKDPESLKLIKAELKARGLL